MAKNKWMWILGFILIVFIIGMYFQNKYEIFSTFPAGTNSIALPCSEAITTKTNGAVEGQCYLYVLNNQQTLVYVQSMEEKSRTRPVSPAYPDGLEATCTITTCSSCWENIFTCDYAFGTNGNQVQICKYDSNCPDEEWKCVNAMCVYKGKTVCSVPGTTSCYSPTQYQKCLSNQHWSGILSCPSGTTCYVDSCLTQEQINELNQNNDDGNDNQNPPSTPIDTKQIITIGVIIGGILLLLKFIK
jgi:hypothetical protein